MKNLREQLITTAEAYCNATGMGMGTLSTHLLNRGSGLKGIAEGKDLYTARYESCMLWLSDNWPDDADWPAGVTRPAISLPSILPSETAATVSPSPSGVSHG